MIFPRKKNSVGDIRVCLINNFRRGIGDVAVVARGAFWDSVA
jgi:hypothetical protein